MRLICLGKYGPYPAAGGASTGYLLQTAGLNILLDCGAGVFARLQDFLPFTGLDAVILSHLHIDHCSDMGILGQALKVQGSGKRPEVYLPATPEKECADIANGPFNTRIIAGGDSICIGDINIAFSRTAHPVECNASRIEHGGRALFFTGDTNWCDSLVQAAAGADVLLCDAAFASDAWSVDEPHLSAAKAGKLASCAGVGRLLLTHMIPGSDEQRLLAEAKEHFANVEVVQEGQAYEI